MKMAAFLCMEYLKINWNDAVDFFGILQTIIVMIYHKNLRSAAPTESFIINNR